MRNDNEIPRRVCLDRLTPAELAIQAAVDAVEALPADERLTDAVVLLQEAREAVADYVDHVDGVKRYPVTSIRKTVDEIKARVEGRKHESAQPCGCDPGIGYKCREHGGE